MGFSQIVIAVGIALPDVLDKANRFFQHDNSHSRVVFISRLSMLEEADSLLLRMMPDFVL